MAHGRESDGGGTDQRAAEDGHSASAGCAGYVWPLRGVLWRACVNAAPQQLPLLVEPHHCGRVRAVAAVCVGRPRFEPALLAVVEHPRYAAAAAVAQALVHALSL